MAKGNVDIRVTLKNARGFIRDGKGVASSIDGVDRAAKRSDGSSRRSSGGVGKLTGAFRSLGPVAGIAASAVGGFALVAGKKAVDTTLDLAATTKKLSTATGMSFDTSSRLAAITKVRGITSEDLIRTSSRLNKSIVAGAAGTGSAADAFKALGVSQDVIKRGKFDEILAATAGGMEKMKNSPLKGASAMTIFGKSYMKLMPLLNAGSKNFKEQMGLAGDLGAVFSDLDIKNSTDFAKAQRDTKLAMLGLQVSLGKKILPMLAKGSIAVTKFIVAWGKNKGTAGEIKKQFMEVWRTLKGLWGTVKSVIDFFKKLGVTGKMVGTVVVQAGKLMFSATFPILGALVRLVKVFPRVKDAAVDAKNWIVKSFADVVSFFSSLPRKISRAVSGAFNGIKEAFRSAINFIIDGWNGLDLSLTIPIIGKKVSVGTPNIPRMASGGRVPGARVAADIIPALLSPGEFVVTSSGERILEGLTGMPGVLSRVGRMQRAHFSGGGRVSPVPAAAGMGQIVTKVYLDRRQIAEAIGSEVAGRAARR